jgi:hypothetical protein
MPQRGRQDYLKQEGRIKKKEQSNKETKSSGNKLFNVIAASMMQTLQDYR